MKNVWKRFHVSARAEQLPPSATLALAAQAGRLRGEGKDVVDLTVGEPDFDTPEHIVEAGCRALRDGMTHYTPTPGIVPLREAIADEFRRVHGMDVGPQNVTVTPGAKYALYLAFEALVDPGDRVLIAAPYWVSYPRMAELACGEPRFLQTSIDEGFRLQPEVLAAALDDKVRVLILNSPSNPTGAAYRKQDLEALAEVLDDYPNVRIVWDDIYRRLLYDGSEYASPATVPGLAQRCVFIDGVSKAYAMTGWRLGWAVGEPDLLASMIRIQSHTTSNAAAVSQAGALAALTGPQEPVEDMRRKFQERKHLVIEEFGRVRGLRFQEPDGAFYLFPDVSQLLADPDVPAATDTELADYILSKALVACVPGTPFGSPGHLRFSFAASMDTLRSAAKRLRDLFGQV